MYDNSFFKDHKATLVVDNEYVSVLRFAIPDRFAYSVVFTFDKKSSTVSITGDWLPLVATNHTNCGNMPAFYEDYCKDEKSLGYFVSKIKAFGSNVTYYSYDDVKHYMVQTLLDYEVELDANHMTLIEDILDNYFDEDYLFSFWSHYSSYVPDEWISYLDLIDGDTYEFEQYVPKRVHDQIPQYLRIFKLAYEQLFNEYNK